MKVRLLSWFAILILSILLSVPAPLCVHGHTIPCFEELPLEESYHVGDTFKDSGIFVNVAEFQFSNEEWTRDGRATVVSERRSGGLNQEIFVNNVNLKFDFGVAIENLIIRYGAYGGNINIEINGDFRNQKRLEDIDGMTISEVHVSIETEGNNIGILHLTGLIRSFAIGGQELFIDCLETDCPTTTVTVTTTITSTKTIKIEVVPPEYYMYTVISIAVAVGIGAAIARHVMRKSISRLTRRTPSVSDLHSVTQKFNEIENLSKPRILPPLQNAEDVNKALQSIRGYVSKARDIQKRLKAAKDEKETVETLVEFIEQIRNSSGDIESFTEYITKKVSEAMNGMERHWFNVLASDLREMQSTLDKAEIMVRQYSSGKLLFEALRKSYEFLVKSALEVEKAFILGDVDQINRALNKLKEAKSKLGEALTIVSQGLADWYSRLSLKKYYGIAATIMK